MVSRRQCSCGLTVTQVSTQPSIALLFHWKPFYEQFAASSMYKFQQEEHGGGGSRGLFHQQFLAPQKWREERTSLGSGEEFERGGREWGGVGLVGGGGMRGHHWRRRGLVRSSRRGVVEDNWTADEECLFAHPEVETPSGWSHQSEGELEMRIRDRGRNELAEGEMCWEKASKRALGWGRSRGSTVFNTSSLRRTVHNAPSTPWRVIHGMQYTTRKTSDRRWPAFLSREKQLLAAEFRRLGIGACLAGTRGRLTP